MASYAQHQKLNKHLIKNIKGNTFLLLQPKQYEKNKISKKKPLRKVGSGSDRREKRKKLARKGIFLRRTKKIKSRISHLINFVRLSKNEEWSQLHLRGSEKALKLHHQLVAPPKH